ncbi:MAG: amino-acid N-acetyltransferase [Cellvibrionaceae bacterium]|nr:amino-acid N-acetyltransferase [Cellvibrionaceae bacterium]
MLSDHYVNWFRHTSPYINAHRNKTFVVMLPGNCIEQPSFNNIVSDLSLLLSLGVRLVVVHGARPQIDRALQDSGHCSQFHDGVRITPREQLGDVLKAVGAMRFLLEASFSSGLPDSPMHGAKIRIRSGNFVTAMPKGVIDGIDHQLTGSIRSVDAAAIQAILNNNYMVLVSPIGYSFTGEAFNLCFSDIAISISSAINADKLIAYNDDGPICDKQGRQYRELTLLKCAKFLAEKQKHSLTNTYFALRSCQRACDAGVNRAHVVSAAEDGALLKELFTRDGSGTMVYRDSYETIRRARIEDVVGILGLIEPLEQQGVLVKRSRELLETEIDYFIVMEKDNMIIACAALYPIQDSSLGELACVAVNADYRNSGRAAKLLTHIERQASRTKVKTLFALTTQTSHWFIEQGFHESDAEFLPRSRQVLYNLQRKSKVLVKNL